MYVSLTRPRLYPERIYRAHVSHGARRTELIVPLVPWLRREGLVKLKPYFCITRRSMLGMLVTGHVERFTMQQ